MVVVTKLLVFRYEDIDQFFGFHCSQIHCLLLAIQITPNSVFFNTKLLYLKDMSFAHQFCCCFTFCNHFNCLIDHTSQVGRFLTWHILTVLNCVNWMLKRWSCIFDSTKITSIISVDGPLLILFWRNGVSPSMPYILSRSHYNIDFRIWSGIITVEQHVIWSVNLSLII